MYARLRNVAFIQEKIYMFFLYPDQKFFEGLEDKIFISPPTTTTLQIYTAANTVLGTWQSVNKVLSSTAESRG